MLPIALLCLFVDQIPPPPAPLLPESNAQSSAESVPADPKAQRKWLLDHLSRELQAQGKIDAQKKQDIETMLKSATDEQLSHAVQYYRQRKAEQLAEAQANLHRLEAYRDDLKRKVERRKQVHEQEQAIMAYGSVLAAQQAQWAMGSFYATPFYVINPPYYYGPRPYRFQR
jgi:hypothetical protein